ncbi:MAG: glycoside hydrolase family 3 N-terminal domain-containing protein [Thermodesulfovibrionales bacterium]
MSTGRISAPDTFEKKLYQLVIGRLNGNEVRNEEYRARITALVEKGIGGFIVFGGKREEVRAFLRSLQSLAALPLLIASDIERGVEQQIAGTTPFPCSMAIAAAIDRNDPEAAALLDAALGAVAAEAIDLGINMPLIPVMDVNRNPDNPIICTRAFSDSPEVVAWFGVRYLSLLGRAGLLPCAKHFPGHGDTAVDSHIALPVIGKSRTDLMATDILPFRRAVEAGARSMMIGHLTIPALDERPASLSRKVISGLLREELGFDGLVLTDALNMDALQEFGMVPVECLNAGADILLHPSDPVAAVRQLQEAAASGALAEETIDTAMARILKAKAGLAAGQAGSPACVPGTIPDIIPGMAPDFSAHRQLSVALVEKSITLVRHAPGFLPIADDDVTVLLAGECSYHAATPLRRHFREVLPLRAAGDLSGKKSVFALFTSVAAWRGSSGIEAGEREEIRALLQKAGPSAVISFGSPYVCAIFRALLFLLPRMRRRCLPRRRHCAVEGRTGLPGSLPVEPSLLPGPEGEPRPLPLLPDIQQPPHLRHSPARLLLGIASGPLRRDAAGMDGGGGVDLHDRDLALVGLPYTLKFLWSPLMDRLFPPASPPARKAEGLDRPRPDRADGRHRRHGAQFSCIRPLAHGRPCRTGGTVRFTGHRRRCVPHRRAAREGARSGSGRFRDGVSYRDAGIRGRWPWSFPTASDGRIPTC